MITVIDAVDKIPGTEPSLYQVFLSYLSPCPFPPHFPEHVLKIESCLNFTELFFLNLSPNSENGESKEHTPIPTGMFIWRVNDEVKGKV